MVVTLIKKDKQPLKQDKQLVKTTSAEQLKGLDNAFVPDTDIYLSDEGYIFLVDMPGVVQGDVTIEVDEKDTLVIQGKSSFETDNQTLLSEFKLGNYYRTFSLSKDMDKDSISAQINHGVLKLTIPKREESKPRRIEITV